MRNPLHRSSRLVVAITALTAVLSLLPACEFRSAHGFGGETTSISIEDGAIRVSVERKDYSLHVESEGLVTFADDESDVATLAAGGSFELIEELDDVERTYAVTSDRMGALSRAYSVDGEARPFDDEARRWVAEALPRMFRESGFDTDARIARLLSRGGPALVLAEVGLMRGESARASYLGRLLKSPDLTAEHFQRALAAASMLESDYELRRTLDAALANPLADPQDGARTAAVLRTANGIESDYERAELLIAAAQRLPDDPDARTAWLDAVRGLDSSFELRRSLDAALERSDAEFAVKLVAVAAERIDSDFELANVLESVAPRAGEPVIGDAVLAASHSLDSDFERRGVLIACLEHARLDAKRLSGVLDSAAEMDSHFETGQVLRALSGKVATDPELSRRYREVAHGLSDYECGQALKALDDALRQ